MGTSQQQSARFADEFAAIIYLPATKKSFLYHTIQNSALVRCQFVPMMQRYGLNSKLLGGIPNDKVGVIADGN